MLNTIGRGSVSKVFLVREKSDGSLFAMKAMGKNVILEHDLLEAIHSEKTILQGNKHPFLAGVEYVFQSETKVYFVMKFYRGGDLFFHLSNAQRMPEDTVRFYAMQIAMALGDLHSRNILYRDQKTENILMDEHGYVSITDFGTSKILKKPDEVTKSFVGCADYLAPELLSSKGYSFAVDWWGLGTLTYELIVGRTPFFVQDDQEKMYKKIRRNDVIFPDAEKHKIAMSKDCKDFIFRLLDKDPDTRLGSKGVKEVLKHPWFKKIDQAAILAKQVEAPFVPEKVDEF